MPSIKLRDKTIKFRKWKIKDKNKFLNNLDNKTIAKEALVYDCLDDKNIVLSNEEYKYLLLHIRAESIQNNIEYVFHCDECSTDFDYIADLHKIITADYKDYGVLSSGNTSFLMGEIKNREFYENNINNVNESEQVLIDFLLHVELYNGNDAFTLESLHESINDMNVDIFDDIMNQWETMKFKIDNTSEVQCPSCKDIQLYEFDDLPNFFPDSWKL